MSDFIVNPPATSCPAPTPNTGASNTSQVTFDGTSLGAIGSVASGTNMNTLLTSLNSWASNTNTSIAYWDTQITAIQATVSATLTSIGNLDSDVIEDIHLGAATPTPYVNLNTVTFPITGTTITDTLTGIDGAIGTIWTTVSGITGGGTLVGEGAWEKSIGNVGIAKSIYKAKVGQGGTRFEKLSDSGLSVTLDDGTVQAYGVVASRQQTTKSGLAATSDNYLYVDVTNKSLTAGYTLKSVAVGAPAPAQTDAEVPIWKITTNATAVTASASLRELKQLDASDITGTLDVATLIGAGTITPSMLNLNAKVDYGGDYSGSYTVRSLVDKAYVDNAVSTASGYWTLSGSNLQYTAGRIQIGAGVIDATAVLTTNGKIRIIDGTEGVGKALVSDANGVGTWTSYIGGSTGDFQWNNGGAFAGASPLVTDGTTIGIGNVQQAPHLVRIDGDSGAATRMLHIEHDETTTASYALEVNLSGVAAAGEKYFANVRVDGGTENQGLIIALEAGAYNSTIPDPADIGLGVELKHATRANYGVYIDATASNSQTNYGLYSKVANAGAGAAYGLIVESGQVGIGSTTVVASALVEMTSTSQGLLPPRMTTVQMNAISSPATGLMVYDTTTNQWMGYNGTSWVILG